MRSLIDESDHYKTCGPYDLVRTDYAHPGGVCADELVEAIRASNFTNCSGLPASTFRLTAVPTQAGTGLRAYCSDQAGVIRYADDGIPASCWTAGKPLQ